MVIGISGKIGSGKDTIGKIIQYLTTKELGSSILVNSKPTTISFELFEKNFKYFNTIKSSFEIKKYAFKLKQIVALLTGCTVDQLEDQEFKKTFLPKVWRRDEYATTAQLLRNYDEVNDPLRLAESMGWVPFKSTAKFHGDGQWVRKGKMLTYREFLQRVGTEILRDMVHEDVHVNALFSDYKPVYEVLRDPSEITKEDPTITSPIYPNWIITDTRFPNEADAIKNRSGLMIRVNRPIKLCDAYLKYINPKADASELHNFLKNFETIAITDSDKAFNKLGYKEGMDYILTHSTFYTDEHPSETSLDNYKFNHVIDNDGTIEELIEKVRDILYKEKLLTK